jgi:hypothetical protein
VKARVPPPCDLVLEPQLGPLLLLEIAAAVASNALRGQHVQIEGDVSHDDTDEVAAARALVRHCAILSDRLRDYRRVVHGRLRRQQQGWPF